MKKHVVLGVMVLVVFFNVAGWAGESLIINKVDKIFSELTRLLESNLDNPKKAALAFKKYIVRNETALRSLQRLFEHQVKKSATFLSLHPNTIDKFVKKFSLVIKIEARLQTVISKLQASNAFAKVLSDFVSLITFELPRGFASSAVARLGQVMDDIIKIAKANSAKPEVAAAALNKYIKANSANLADLQKELLKETDAMKKDPSKMGDFMKKFAPVIKKSMELQKITAELMKNPAFAKAMASFQAASSAK